MPRRDKHLGPLQFRSYSLQLGPGKRCSDRLEAGRDLFSISHHPGDCSNLPAWVFPREVSLPMEDLYMCPVLAELTTFQFYLCGPLAGAVVEGADSPLLLGAGWMCCWLH